jgi:hypothetical protein
MGIGRASWEISSAAALPSALFPIKTGWASETVRGIEKVSERDPARTAPARPGTGCCGSARRDRDLDAEEHAALRQSAEDHHADAAKAFDTNRAGQVEANEGEALSEHIRACVRDDVPMLASSDNPGAQLGAPGDEHRPAPAASSD